MQVTIAQVAMAVLTGRKRQALVWIIVAVSILDMVLTMPLNLDELEIHADADSTIVAPWNHPDPKVVAPLLDKTLKE